NHRAVESGFLSLALCSPGSMLIASYSSFRKNQPYFPIQKKGSGLRLQHPPGSATFLFFLSVVFPVRLDSIRYPKTQHRLFSSCLSEVQMQALLHCCLQKLLIENLSLIRCAAFFHSGCTRNNSSSSFNSPVLTSPQCFFDRSSQNLSIVIYAIMGITKDSYFRDLPLNLSSIFLIFRKNC